MRNASWPGVFRTLRRDKRLRARSYNTRLIYDTVRIRSVRASTTRQFWNIMPEFAELARVIRRARVRYAVTFVPDNSIFPVYLIFPTATRRYLDLSKIPERR